jgi:hypothetical protein
MTLTQNDRRETVLVDEDGMEHNIHIFHCTEDLDEIREDLWTPYVVFEQATNFPVIHLLTAPNEYEALSIVFDHILEAGDTPTELSGHRIEKII